jgi:hypothetical protein
MVTEPASTQSHPAMLTPSSSTTVPSTVPSSFSIPITEKHTKTNYLVWRQQVLPSIRATQLEDLLYNVEKMLPKTLPVQKGETTTDKPNPEYIAWMTHEQALLGYLVSSMARMKS